MRGILRLWSASNRSARLRMMANGKAQLRFEELECRTVPSVTAFHQAATDIRLDVMDLRSDVQAMTRQVGSNPTSTVKTDLTNLNSALNSVVGDLIAGRSASSDLMTLLNAQGQLKSDLGTSLRPSLRNSLRDFARDQADLVKDLSHTATSGVQKQFQDLQSDLQELTTKLGSNVSSTVMNDLNKLSSDLSAVSSDLSSGLSATKDLDAIFSDTQTLLRDLGTGATDGVRDLLRDLRQDANLMLNDLGHISNSMTKGVNDIRSDTQSLVRSLASNSSAQQDLGTLTSDLSTLAGDLAGGKSITNDLSKVMTDVSGLVSDVGSAVKPQLTHRLNDLVSDVLGLALQSGAFQGL